MVAEVSHRSLNPFAWVRSLYDWVVGLSERPNAVRTLFVIAFAESSFFPVPPDVLLIPLALGAPRRALRFAALCTVGSSLGALLGYWLGLEFYELIIIFVIALSVLAESLSVVSEHDDDRVFPIFHSRS